MAIVHLLTGSNLGNREKLLKSATSMLEESVGKIIKKSSIFETQPWGFKASTFFFNQVLKIETHLSPREVLMQINIIEKELGRTRSKNGYSSRMIDIDILLYDNLQLNENDLIIPHPRMHKRKFTMVPMAEIDGSLEHPILKTDMNSLNETCEDDMHVEIYKSIN